MHPNTWTARESKVTTGPWPHGSVGWCVIPHTNMLWVWYSVGVLVGGNWSTSLSLSFFLSPPLSPFLSHKINIHILGWGFEKKKKADDRSLEVTHTHTPTCRQGHIKRGINWAPSPQFHWQLLNDTGRGLALPFNGSESQEWAQLETWHAEMMKRSWTTRHSWDILTSSSSLKILKWFFPAALLSCFNNQRWKLGV